MVMIAPSKVWEIILAVMSERMINKDKPMAAAPTYEHKTISRSVPRRILVNLSSFPDSDISTIPICYFGNPFFTFSTMGR
jgi:hypothetical protein